MWFTDEQERVVIKAAVVILLLLLSSCVGFGFFIGRASAHGPWPYECCSDNDCSEIDSKYVKEIGDSVHITFPPGHHPKWPADGRPPFSAIIPRSSLKKPVSGEWSICIYPSGTIVCVFPPQSGA